MTGNHAALLRRAGADTTDRDLLARFAAGRDEAAFAELVRRHGPAVLGVCRRTAGHREDAEDAFQAAFVVLARKAEAVANPDALGPWLRGVAYRVASRARRAALRRRRREVPVPDVPHPPTFDRPPDPDAAAVVEAELAALREHHRAAVLLCDVAGLSRADAAARLGVPEGTLSSRLNAARKKLAAGLTRRGVAAPAAGLAALVGGAADADVPVDLFERTVATAVAGATGGVIPADVAALATEGGAIMGKVIGAFTAVVLAAGAAGVAVVWAAPPESPPKPTAAAPKDAAPPTPTTTDAPPPPPVAVKAAKPAAGKARMVSAVEHPGTLSRLLWSPDGRFLVAQGTNTVKVFDGQALQDLFTLGSTGEFVGFQNPHTLVTYSAGSGRINSPKRVWLWDLRDPSSGAPTATIDWDVGDGQPVGVSPAGVVLSRYEPAPAADGEPRPRGTGTVRVRLLDTATGETGPDLMTLEDVSNGVALFAVAPAGDRLVVACQARDAGAARTIARVAGYSLPDGKKLWSSTVEGDVAGHATPVGLALSADGSLAALGYDRPVAAGGGDPLGGGAPINLEYDKAVTLLDARTGGPGPRLPPVPVAPYPLGSLSADGRLLALRGSAVGRTSLQVWGTRTGTLLKSWDGHATVAFAPNRPVLAVLETWTVPDRTQPLSAGPFPSHPRTDRSSVGFWDLSGLLK